MNLPTHFYLKRRKWTVEIVEEKLSNHEHDNCRGLCTKEDRLIEISANQTPRNMMITFLHEFLHAISFEYGFPIPHILIYKLERPLAYIVNILINIQ